MSIEGTDLRDAEFMRLLRARDFSGAHAALDRLAAEQQMSETSRSLWKAHIHQFEGKPDEASALLAPFIEANDLRGKLFRSQRARIMIHHGRLDEARKDLEALLEESHPRIEPLHVGCRIQIAYIFAVQGDERFENVFSEIPDGRDYFIKDGIYGKDDLRRLYQANCTKARRRSRG